MIIIDDFKKKENCRALRKDEIISNKEKIRT